MCDDDHGNGVPRRALFVTGAAAALTLGSVTFASGADAAGGPGTPASGTETRTVRYNPSPIIECGDD
jgi:hypothetical protein